MSDDKVTVLDSALQRLGHFKVRCSKLEGALCDAIIIAEESNTRPDIIRRWRAILADTNQEERLST